MYRSRSARSTRAARGSTKGRRGGRSGGFADKIRRAAESGPTRKWVKVMRPPGSKIRFLVSKWVPFSELTEEERLEYEKEQAALQENQEMLSEGDEPEHETSEEANDPGAISTDETASEVSNCIEPTATEETASPEKRELSHEALELLDEPPSKRAKVEE